MNYFSFYLILLSILLSRPAEAQRLLTANQGHSHNDYHQKEPLLTAYNAGMGSIEADVFLKNGALYVAHDTTEITPGVTLRQLYLEPLAKLYTKNGNKPYPNAAMKLQLVIDIKTDHEHVIPELISELEAFKNIFNSTKNPSAIKVAISGDVPKPESFKDYPAYISFDGRPYTQYTEDQLIRVVMISDNIKNYTSWDGKAEPTDGDVQKLKAVVAKAHQNKKTFRFWATNDSPASWKVLENLGVDWINTDTPKKLKEFFDTE